MSKDVFSTGEAAWVARLSQQTISHCFDTGRLEGYLVPGSRHRRIPRESLERFLREHDIPTDRLESDR
jgi:excisionase family DNA binding protein